ncbi:recombinase family protein [Tumebacillus permanentifrigoris]|uniref:DNA invertase Pin-like site-specific DNA recombinase n=1 Tax=Tumebacillus permanentifrigoris TaxID=378543 RepID=A0A316D7C7_9BACL|nr:recombinase family protein [Tumebacillus permanentifrigoris]PWK05289.1 DNA invertase Pin-like site-specific DNA recombinase [Tumebacillus permanentifrigoris]
MAYKGFPQDLDVAWYLRKSREDLEAEERARREGRVDIDTLSKHRKRLLEISRQNCWTVVDIFEEVVSGELIDERPEVIKLLENVEARKYDGVVCVEIDRLGRGDSADQGIIQRAFRDSETLILTPDKAYDMNDDLDEEMVEFKSFFARREGRGISRRMQNGRVDSVNEGYYIGTYEPFGYYRDRNVGLKLLIDEKSADIVRKIFEWYAESGIGTSTIAERLNHMGIPCPSNTLRIRNNKPINPSRVWQANSILQILRNEVYVGKIQWRKTKTMRRRMENGRYKKIKSIDRPRDQWIEKKGLHEPIITNELFKRTQEILESRSNRELVKDRQFKNSLASIVICKKCGQKMQRRPYANQLPHLKCPTKGCMRSSQIAYVEEKVIEALREWYNSYKVQHGLIDQQLKKTKKRTSFATSILKELEEEIAATVQQKENLHKFLERGTYDDDTYLARNKVLSEQHKDLLSKKDAILKEVQQEAQYETTQQNVIPLVRHVLDVYNETEDLKEKNKLLKSVIHKIVYSKRDDAKDREFEIDLYPISRSTRI